jgi:hypothetical protein
LETAGGFVVCRLLDEPVNDLAPRQITGWIGLLDRIWRILASPYLTVILLVWTAVVLTFSAVIPQAPPHVEDAVVRSQWLADIPLIARPLVERLQPLGLLNLLGSAWLRLPLALLIAHSLVVLADWIPALWNRLGWPIPASAEDEAWQDEIPGPGTSFRLDGSWAEASDQPRQHAMQRLAEAGYRVWLGAESAPPDSGQSGFVAWRWRWSWLAGAGVYAGLGLAALGLILGGWLNQVNEVDIQPGNPAPLSSANVPTLAIDRVTAVGDDPLRPAAAEVSLRVLTGAGEGQPLTLSLHDSRLFQGMWLTLFDLRPIATVTATDVVTGDKVLLQPFSAHTPPQEAVRLPLAENPEARFVGVPARNVTVRVDYQPPANRSSPPTFTLFFFRGVETRPNQSLSLKSGSEVTLDRIRYRLTFDYEARLRVNSTLWWPVVAGGWAIVALSFVLLAVAPPVRVRGRWATDDKGCHITLAVDTWDGEQRLRQALRALLTPDQ